MLAGGVLLVGALGVLFLLPFLFDAEAQRGALSVRLEGLLQRKVKMGRMKLALLPPALRVEDAEIAEALGFGNPTFSSARQLRARVNLLPLLRGNLEIAWLELEEPSIRLVKNERGEWNFSSLGRDPAAKPGKSGAAGRAQPFQIGEMRIRDGALTVTDLGRKGLTSTYENIDLTVRNLSPRRPFEFQVAAHIPGSGKGMLQAEGTGGPLDPNNLAASPAQGKARFEEVDLRSLVTFTGQSGLAGLFSGQTTFSSDGRVVPVEGTFRVERLRVSPKGGPAQAPLSGKYKLLYNADTQRLELREVEFTSGKSVGRLGGRLDFSRPAASELTARTSNAFLPDVARLMPAFGVKLPAGSTLAAGTLNLSALLRGPFERANGRAAVEIRKARLAGYGLGGQLAAVAKIAGVPTGPDTEIEKLHANLNFVNGTTSTNDLELVAPGMTVTGAGSATEAGALDFRMTATLTRAGTVLGALQKLSGGTNTVPFLVSGTFEHPIIRPDVGRMAQQQAEQRTGVVGKVLGGLFGKKKN